MISVIVLFAAVPPSAFAMTVFNSESDFLAAAPIVSTETFDGFATGPLTNDAAIEIDYVNYRVASTGECSGFPPCWYTSTWLAVSTPNRLGSNELPSTDHIISFGLGGFVAAFGFHFTGPRDGEKDEIEWTITINEIDGTENVIEVSKFTSSSSAPYYGFLSDVGIQQVVVVGGLTGQQPAFGFDNVSRSEIIPIPAAVWLFGSALGILGWVRRRKA